jgi:hypothetical protein
MKVSQFGRFCGEYDGIRFLFYFVERFVSSQQERSGELVE